MPLYDTLLPDFDHEMAATRRLLERVPASAMAWKPHDKSFSMGQLAMHHARLVSWGEKILKDDAYDMAEASGQAPPEPPNDPTEVLAAFDRNVAAVRKHLVGRTDGELDAPWELRNGKQLLLSLPRVAALRRFVIHHLIHHRGQLSVYLRLQNVPLPPIYGPTADERT